MIATLKYDLAKHNIEIASKTLFAFMSALMSGKNPVAAAAEAGISEAVLKIIEEILKGIFK